jgi:hypothetical protein
MNERVSTMQEFGRVGRVTGFICVMLALLTVAGMSARIPPELWAGGLSNPDSYMRLVRLRDMLDSGRVLFVVARDGSGHGTMLHWSHLVDSLLILLSLPFRLVLSPEGALYAAALVWGPLNLAALAFAVVWAGAPFAARGWLFLGAILPVLSPAIASYGLAGVVHHHVAIVICSVACWGFAARLIAGRAAPASCVALGAWIGAGVWFTPESVPLTMLAFGALWLAWIAYPSRADLARAIGLTGMSFALTTTLALLADPPSGGWTALDIDRLSLLFAGLGWAVAATGCGLWALHGKLQKRTARIATALAVAVLCAGVWAVTFRAALFGGNMLLDQQQRDAMFGHISEMLPVGNLFQALHFLFTGLLAALLVVVMGMRRRSLFASYVALCLGAALALGWTHVRFAAYPEAAGAIALPIALTMASAAMAKWHQIGQSFARMAIILLFIQVPYIGQLPDLTSSAHAAPFGVVPACKPGDAVPLLRKHPGAVVLADVNDTPELLWKTGVRTVGSLYHRNVAGFSRLRAAWRVAPAETVPPEIDAAEISLVLGCETPVRSSLVDGVRTATLYDQVRTGNPPPWLRQIDENPVSGHALYEVIRPGATASR